VLALAGCASEPPEVAGVLRGYLTFEADYQDIDPVPPASWGPPPLALTEGLIPNGTAPLPLLWLCAYELVCESCDEDPSEGVDARPDNGSQSDDHLLGCTLADTDGSYELEILNNPPNKRPVDLYLVTWFCNGPNEPIAVPNSPATYARTADFCVSQNLKKGVAPASGDWPGGPAEDRARTKYLWSRTYRGSEVWDQETVIAWNLSCPQEDGLDREEGIACVGQTQGWEQATCEDGGFIGCLDGPNADNSNTSWNKEAVHGFRALAQSPVYRPSADNTVEDASLWDGTDSDWIRVYIKEADMGDPDNRIADCPSSCASNGSQDGGTDWLALRQSSLASPTAPVHELGHLIHGRWLNAHIADDCRQPSGWGAGAGADEQARVNEGFADFWATAAWFPRDHHAPVFTTRRRWEMEDATSPQLSPCPATDGKGREAQFFWDLYDVEGEQPGDEAASFELEDFLRTWSRFSASGVPENRASCDGLGECGVLCQGRNINDFLYHLDAVAPNRQVEWDAVRELNCLTEYSDPFP
jgi:hypothetical protein